MAKRIFPIALLLAATACGSSSKSGGSGASKWAGEPGSIWLTAGYDDAVDRLDTATGKVVEKHDITSVGTEPTSIAIGGGSVWFTLNGHDQLSRLTADGKVEATDAQGAYEVAFGEGAAWASAGGIFVVRVDPQSGNSTATVQTKSGIIEDPIAVGGGAAWVAAGTSIDRVDAATNQVSASIALSSDLPGVQGVLSPLAYGENALWLLAYYGTPGKRAIVKIDPATNSIAAKQDVATDGADDGLVTGFGAVWVSSEGGQKILKISPSTLAVEQEFPVNGNPTRLAVGNKYLYAVDFSNSLLWRLDPATGDAASVDIPLAEGIAFAPAN